jgi:hypothetical protein
MSTDTRLIETALGAMDADTLTSIAAAARRESDRFAAMPGAEARKWWALYAAIAACAETALLRRRTGVAV